MTVAETQVNENVLDNLFVKGVCVDLTIKSWQARKNAKAHFKALGIDASAWQNNVLTGTQIKFIDDDTRRSFQEHEARARQWINVNSYSFLGKDGIRFVPYTALDHLLHGTENKDGLKKMQEKFKSAVKSFLGNFDEIRNQYINNMAALNEKYRSILEENYPNKSEVEAKFTFDIRFFEVKIPKGEDETDEVSFDEAVGTAAARQEVAKEMKEQLQKEAIDFVSKSAAELRGYVHSALNKFEIQLKSGKTIRSTSLDAIRHAVQQFKVLNFVDDKEVQKMLDDFHQQLHGMENIKTDEASTLDSMRRSVGTILDQLNDKNTLSQTTGRYLRSIGKK